ncbi:sensor histidine kinase [Limisalsivibrio acetivorans]|uniref:sensor histidine kinase n=1 Tax=Limisalsivibrio acetivorans TaxID=1304888 RepID=UPI0003B6E341|nr:HAMP domain-containing histidine kinase [Limisalsivibrio acetivorans]
MDYRDLDNDTLLGELARRLKEGEGSSTEMKNMMRRLEQMNDRLMKAEENKSKFMSLVRNNFNNPISSLMNLSKSLSIHADSEETKGIGSTLYYESLRLNFQVNNIITAAEIEAGTIVPYIGSLSPTAVMEQVKEFLHFLFMEKNISMEWEENLSGEFYQDKELVYLAVANAIHVIGDAADEGGSVKVSFAGDGESISVTVNYTGTFLSNEHAERSCTLCSAETAGGLEVNGNTLEICLVRELTSFLMGGVESAMKKSGMEIVLNIPNVDADKAMAYGDDMNEFFFDEEEGFDEF